MSRYRSIQKRALHLLCVLLILACISVVLLPHFHVCPDMDCPVCAAFSATRMLFGALLATFLALHLTRAHLKPLRTGNRPTAERDGTPVGLKVKLSD